MSMAVSQPNLTATLALVSVTNQDDDISIYDATGTYNAVTNPGGYGLSGGPAVNDVTGVVITVTPNFLATTLVYTLTILNGVITAATLSIGGFAATNILAALTSTVWPFSSTVPFLLFKEYVDTPPVLIDDVVKVDYRITGTSGVDPFDFTTTSFQARTTDAECCVKEKFQALHPIQLDGDDYDNAVYLKGLLYKIEYAGRYGDLAGALDAFTELKRDCDCGC